MSRTGAGQGMLVAEDWSNAEVWRMQEDQQSEPKPQASVPPPRRPRGPIAVVGGPDEEPPNNRKETVRINMPPKPTASPTIKIPTTSATVLNWPTTPVASKRKPWWKFW